MPRGTQKRKAKETVAEVEEAAPPAKRGKAAGKSASKSANGSGKGKGKAAAAEASASSSVATSAPVTALAPISIPSASDETIALVKEKCRIPDVSGTVLVSGAMCWDETGRTKDNNAIASSCLLSAHRVDGLKKLRFRHISSGPTACHSILVTDAGVPYCWVPSQYSQAAVSSQVPRLSTRVSAKQGQLHSQMTGAQSLQIQPPAIHTAVADYGDKAAETTAARRAPQHSKSLTPVKEEALQTPARSADAKPKETAQQTPTGQKREVLKSPGRSVEPPQAGGTSTPKPADKHQEAESPARKSLSSTFEFGKRSRTSVEESPEQESEEPRSKRPRPVSQVRPLRSSRRTKDVSLEEDSPPMDIKPFKEEEPDVGMAEESKPEPEEKKQPLAPVKREEDERTKHVGVLEPDIDLPSNLMFVHTASLLQTTACDRARDSDAPASSSVVNFKKFRKYWPLSGPLPTRRQKMPRIIGGDALVVHTNTFRELDEFLMQEQEANAEMRRQDEFAAELFRKEPTRNIPRGRPRR